MPELRSYPRPQAVRPEKLDLGQGSRKTGCLCLGSKTSGRVAPRSVLVGKESEQGSKCQGLRSQPWHRDGGLMGPEGPSLACSEI